LRIGAVPLWSHLLQRLERELIAQFSDPAPFCRRTIQVVQPFEPIAQDSDESS